MAAAVAGSALANMVLVGGCNTACCVRQGWTERPRRAARVLRQRDLEQTVDARLMDHETRIQGMEFGRDRVSSDRRKITSYSNNPRVPAKVHTVSR